MIEPWFFAAPIRPYPKKTTEVKKNETTNQLGLKTDNNDKDASAPTLGPLESLRPGHRIVIGAIAKML